VSALAHPGRRGGRRFALALAALLAVAGLLAARAEPSAAGGKNFNVGFADILYQGPHSAFWMGKTKQVNADVVRINLYWSVVAPTKPSDPTNPNSPEYNWAPYDTAISNAAARGFDIDLTVFSAPSWAEGPNRPSLNQVRAGAWRPDADAFGQFGRAVAKRYGDRVKYFEAWNEPNLRSYIEPQWNGKDNVAVDIYSTMLNSFYDGVNAVDPAAKIVVGGTAPYGDPPGGPNRTQPVRFYQELLCLNRHNKKTHCPAGGRPKFDVIAHHPINREDPPTAHAINKGDVEIADMHELTKVLRAAERRKTPATKGRHAIWANEVWWQTNPPDKREGVSLQTHARWTQQGMYILWKQGVSDMTFLQLRDAAYTPGEPTLASYQTGIFTFGGKAKPTAHAVTFPFVTDKKGKRLLAWGIAPKSGRLKIQVKGGKKKHGRAGTRFRRAASVKVKAGKVFTKKLRVSTKGKTKLRATVGGQKSLVWVQK
jgi:hypothetical protein